MNYIWDLLIRAEEEGISKKDIHFILAENFSPYMELSPKLLNANLIEKDVEVNPYYRFHNIFKNLFQLENDKDTELREKLFDIVLHFLAEIDCMQGMNKREFFIQFVLREIYEGIFGERIQEKIQIFSKKEQEIVALNIMRLYQTGDEIYLLKDTMKKLFQDCIIYAKSEENNELLVYIGQKQSKTNQLKVQLVQESFLPMGFQMEIYWDNHFGIIAVEETMKLDRIVLY